MYLKLVRLTIFYRNGSEIWNYSLKVMPHIHLNRKLNSQNPDIFCVYIHKAKKNLKYVKGPSSYRAVNAPFGL